MVLLRGVGEPLPAAVTRMLTGQDTPHRRLCRVSPAADVQLISGDFAAAP